MAHTDRALLHMHVEAVWGVQLPPIEQNEITLLPESSQPDWRLCAAELAEGRILIWRAAVEQAERVRLLTRVDEAWHLPMDKPSPPDISREVAFCLSSAPPIKLATARKIARQLAPADYPLIVAFPPGKAEEMLQPELRPLIGVVVDGRLLSLAHSSRRTAVACELGVDTLPQARRQGYALAATVVWSATIAKEGLTPLYSALLENTASLHLAIKAGYRQFARAVTLV